MQIIERTRRAAAAFARSKSESERQSEAELESVRRLETEPELDGKPKLELDLQPSTQRPFDPESDEIEALYQATFGAGARVVAVIGVVAGDGASSCASALAQRSMLGRKSTLLVGTANAALPHYCRALKNAPDYCLTAGSEAQRLCQICVAPRKTAQAVDLAWKRFGGGEGGEDSALQLREPAYLRRRWIEKYGDWSAMVLDCEPALAEGSTFPGRLVAQSADAVILVARGGAATPDSLAAAKAALGSAKIVGIALNGCDQPKVGAEIAQRVRRNFGRFPRLSKFLADRAESMSLFDVGV